MTEKRRLETAAPAIKLKIVSRRMPLVFLPVFPLRKGSTPESMIGDVVVEIVGHPMSTDMPRAPASPQQGWEHVTGAN
jgi:hypothetical protein